MSEWKPVKGAWMTIIGKRPMVDSTVSRRIERVTPTGIIVLVGMDRKFRPYSDDMWVHNGPKYGRFGLRESTYIRPATAAEIAAAEVEESRVIEDERRRAEQASRDRKFLASVDWTQLNDFAVTIVADDVRKQLERVQKGGE